MAPRGMTGHSSLREQIKKKKHGQISYKKHIEENNGLLSLFFKKAQDLSLKVNKKSQGDN